MKRPHRFDAVLLGRGSVIALAVLICVACSDITSDLQRTSDSIAPDEIVAVYANAAELPADGMSIATVEARIPVDARSRTVTFTTTAGVFLESGSKEVKVFAARDADAPGKRLAFTDLRSDTATSTAIIRAAVGEYYDTLSIRFTNP